MIYNENCLEVFKKIEDETIDLIVTDCPYHIVSGGCTSVPRKDECGGMLAKRNAPIAKDVKKGNLFGENQINFSDWVGEAYRVLKQQSHCYIFINARNLKKLQQACEEVGFTFQQMLIWDKGNSTPNKWYLNSFEIILMLRKGKAKNINNMGTKNIIKVPNIIGKKTHPTEKPVKLNQILIENSSKVGDIVLDPFMGTGSCGVACQNTNRKFIGIELDEHYFEVAKERLKK